MYCVHILRARSYERREKYLFIALPEKTSNVNRRQRELFNGNEKRFFTWKRFIMGSGTESKTSIDGFYFFKRLFLETINYGLMFLVGRCMAAPFERLVWAPAWGGTPKIDVLIQFRIFFLFALMYCCRTHSDTHEPIEPTIVFASCLCHWLCPIFISQTRRKNKFAFKRVKLYSLRDCKYSPGSFCRKNSYNSIEFQIDSLDQKKAKICHQLRFETIIIASLLLIWKYYMWSQTVHLQRTTPYSSCAIFVQNLKW